MFREIDACYFIYPYKSKLDRINLTNIHYCHSVAPEGIDTRTIQHLVSPDSDIEINELAKFLSHILICENILLNKYKRSVVSEAIFDTDVLSKVAGLDFAFNKFNVLSTKSAPLCYLIGYEQANIILDCLPWKIFGTKSNYFLQLVDKMFLIRNNFSIDVKKNKSNADWTFVFEDK